MKSLDERLSCMVSPFDESGDMTQEELMIQQHFLYEKDSLIESIGKSNSKIVFDLNLEDVLEKMPDEQTYRSFVDTCLIRLCTEYYLDPLLDHINRNEIVNLDPDSVMKLVKYIARYEWVNSISGCLPEFDPVDINNTEVVKKKLSESFLNIKNKIIKMSDIHPLIHFYFTFCSDDGGLKTMFKLVMSDLPGIISIQAVNKMINGRLK